MILNIILIILAIVGGLVALFLLIAAFSKKKYTVAREISIDKPRQEVFDYLKHLKNQDHYSKWVMELPDKKTTFTGTDGAPGFVYTWDDRKSAGAQEIKRIVPNESIDMEIRFLKPFKGVAQASLFTKELPGNGQGHTQVKWTFASQMPFPMNAMMVFMNIENFLGKDLDLSLGNLKAVLERR
ncbi:SRPBCC family protein [Chryseolinea lacunae]|uniref:SRPBCC family protein n=1 Tax=Chryseolinea lacunae TaxID=2801331 RepID=A0ABS1L2K0_9BACT|nr:SRPBCC family protein [Chryseolinea lacunae]MBL0745916.1 SRPBCC family protein [Chryseolinea lacunae]